MEVQGSIGIGLAWGWLLGARRGSPLTFGVLAAMTTAVAVESALLAGPGVVLPLLGAAVVAATLHAAWLRRLGRRAGARAATAERGGGR